MKKLRRVNTAHIFKALVAVFLLLAALSIGTFIIVLRAHNSRAEAYALRLALNSAVHESAVSSEVLSRWTRSLAVVGGDIKYEMYREEMDRARFAQSMATFTELSTCEYELEILDRMHIARTEITRLEQEVFRLHAEYCREEAIAVSHGDEFSALSTGFITDAFALIALVDERTQGIVDAAERRISFAAPTSVAVLVLLMITGAFALLAFRGAGRTELVVLIAMVFIGLSAAAIYLSLAAMQYSRAMSNSYALRTNLTVSLYEMELSTERLTRLSRSFAVMGDEYRYNAYRREAERDRFNATFYTFNILDAPAEIFNTLVNLIGRVTLLRQLDEQLLQLRVAGYVPEAIDIAFSAEYDYLEMPINATSRRVREDIDAFAQAKFDAARAGYVSANLRLVIAVASLIFLGLLGLHLRRNKISPEDKIAAPWFVANATISTKLFASFAIVIIAFLFNIMVIHYYNAQITRLNSHNTEVMAARRSIVASCHQQFTEMRRLLRESFMNPEWLETANAGARLYFERRISEAYMRMTELTAQYRSAVAGDTLFPPAPNDSRLFIMEQIEDYAYLVYTTFRDNFFLDGNMSHDHGNVLRYAGSAEVMIGLLGNFAEINQGRLNRYILQYRVQVNMITGLAVVSAVALALIASHTMLRVFNKKIEAIENDAATVAHGNFDTIIESRATDEISKIFNDLARVFLRLIDEIKQVSHENKMGNSNARIDITQFEGGYRDTVVSINDMLDSISEMMDNKEKMIIAEQNSNVKSKFLATMSHEIRTPITAVIGISEMQLQNIDLPPNIEEAFAKIHSSANILLSIINDILDLSKIESGKMEIVPVKYDVASMLSDVAQLNLSYLGSKELEFTLEVDKNLPSFLIGDDLRIKQVLNNLLSNAFKYTVKGHVCLEVRKEEEFLPGHINVSFAIRDTGRGMNKEQAQTLFNEYSRFTGKDFHLVAGTGLGMPITYNLTQMMNGDIDVSSSEGVGTTVTVLIPQEVASTETLSEQVIENLREFKLGMYSASKRFAFKPEPMPYGRVLIVDDTEANLYVAKGLLTFYSLNIETCASGYDAIEKIERGNAYDIIFMDHMMPGMDGIEAVAKLRGMGYPHPIVALTANALVGQAEMFLQNGFNGFLSKPIQTVHLNAVLIKFIRDKQPLDVIEAAIAESLAAKNDINDYQNDAKLLRKLRADFVRNYKNSFRDISRALDKGDITTAHILTHTIKNLAAMINETALQQAAEQLERTLKEGKMPESEQLSSLETEIAAALANTAEPEEPGTAPNKEKSAALFDELSPLLETRYAKSIDFIPQLREIPETAILIRQMQDFDFKSAAKTLQTLRKVLDI